MMHRNYKKTRKWNIFTFILVIFNIAKYIFYTAKLSINIFSNKFIQLIIDRKKNISFKILIKQFFLIFAFFYYIFQIISPSGFLFTIIKQTNRYISLHNEIKHLRCRQIYLANTIKAIENENQDTIEELMIVNTGKQDNKNRKFLYLESI